MNLHYELELSKERQKNLLHEMIGHHVAKLASEPKVPRMAWLEELFGIRTVPNPSEEPCGN